MPYESTNVTLDRLCDFDADEVREGIERRRAWPTPARRSDDLAEQMTAPEADC